MATVIDLDKIVESQGTFELDRNRFLHPDGSGGLVWEGRFLETGRQVYEYTDFIQLPGIGLFSHFLQGVPGGAGTITGASGTPFALTQDHPGLWALGTGVGTNTGRAFMISAAFGTINLGANRTRVGYWVLTGGDLSDATDRYLLRAGIGAVSVPAINFGVFFEYTDDVNGGRWQGVTVDGISRTSTDTGITVAADTWYKLEWEVNAAGTLVEYFIDGVLVTSNTTNIPTGDTYDHFMNLHIMKTGAGAGLNPRFLIVDAAYFQMEVTR